MRIPVLTIRRLRLFLAQCESASSAFVRCVAVAKTKKRYTHPIEVLCFIAIYICIYIMVIHMHVVALGAALSTCRMAWRLADTEYCVERCLCVSCDARCSDPQQPDLMRFINARIRQRDYTLVFECVYRLTVCCRLLPFDT